MKKIIISFTMLFLFGLVNFAVSNVYSVQAQEAIPEESEKYHWGWNLIDDEWYFNNEWDVEQEPEWSKDGVHFLGSSYYIFDAEGIMLTGWQSTSLLNYDGDYKEYTVYASNTGALAKGWQNLEGQTYYFDSYNTYSGEPVMVNDVYYIGGNRYFFETNGSLILDSKFIEYEGSTYYIKNGMISSFGWERIGNYWYYFDEYEGSMMSDGIYSINNKEYIFNDKGIMQANKWVKLNDNWYHTSASGAVSKGWTKINNQWYYLNEYFGEMETGLISVKNDLYFLNESGVMQSNGWINDYNQWYYAKSSGALYKNQWLNLNRLN